MDTESIIELNDSHQMSVGDTFYLNGEHMVVTFVNYGDVHVSLFFPWFDINESLVTKPKQPNFARFQNNFKRRGK